MILCRKWHISNVWDSANNNYEDNLLQFYLPPTTSKVSITDAALAYDATPIRSKETICSMTMWFVNSILQTLTQEFTVCIKAWTRAVVSSVSDTTLFADKASNFWGLTKTLSTEYLVQVQA